MSYKHNIIPHVITEYRHLNIIAAWISSARIPIIIVATDKIENIILLIDPILLSQMCRVPQGSVLGPLLLPLYG